MKEQAPASTTCRFRYRGYHENGGVRAFAFEDVAAETNRHPVVIDVDVQLLLKHHVHFQDAPQLCLLLLSVNPLTANESTGTAVRIILSDVDLTDLLARVDKAPFAKKKKKA